jgi:glycosyltransferase involved in cell wall biosynthesis
MYDQSFHRSNEEAGAPPENPSRMSEAPLVVAWFSFFPVEWLPDVPDEVRQLPRLHPASWQRVLLDQYTVDSRLKLHIIVVRKQLKRNLEFTRKGVTFHLVKVPGGVRASTMFWVDTWVIGRVLKKIRPDVVHAWGTEQGAAVVANRLGYPSVVTIQGLISWYEQVVPQNWHVRLAGYIERYSLPRVPVVTTEACFTADWLRSHYPKLRVEQVEHAPDPVFHAIIRQPTLTPVRLLFVGALDYRKGGDILLLALEQLRSEIDFEIIVVGKVDPEVASLVEGKVSHELWKRLVFKENLSHLQVAEELRTTTMAVCSSRADVSPNSVKEAVVAGVPVIGCAVGGIPDYVLPGRNGVLVQPGSVQELVNGIRVACAHPLFREGRVESAVLAEMRGYLSPIKMARRFLEAYQLALQIFGPGSR